MRVASVELVLAWKRERYVREERTWQERFVLIKQIQLERSQLSLNFFNKNAEKFREKQGLIVEHADYHGALLSVIEGLGLEQHASVMEVGPGEGQLLTRLAAKFSDLTALDNSRDMLERSRQAISDSGARAARLPKDHTYEQPRQSPTHRRVAPVTYTRGKEDTCLTPTRAALATHAAAAAACPASVGVVLSFKALGGPY